jgi:hypothetical protein
MFGVDAFLIQLFTQLAPKGILTQHADHGYGMTKPRDCHSLICTFTAWMRFEPATEYGLASVRNKRHP